MTPEKLKSLLESLERGDADWQQVLQGLRSPAADVLDEATVDLDRTRRCGFPEVIFGAGKTVAQVEAVAASLVEHDSAVLATRLSEEAMEALRSRYPHGRFSNESGLFWLPRSQTAPPAGLVGVISAGTSDQPVAEEAAWTAEAYGTEVRRIRDVGVAGIHRLLKHQDALRQASALVVVAGMEGALPSVVGGLTDRPVIGVPTSVGYGASFGGVAALLAMLNSCAAGVTVVNIDNGFGAGVQASKIARLHGAARLSESKKQARE